MRCRARFGIEEATSRAGCAFRSNPVVINDPARLKQNGPYYMETDMIDLKMSKWAKSARVGAQWGFGVRKASFWPVVDTNKKMSQNLTGATLLRDKLFSSFVSEALHVYCLL